MSLRAAAPNLGSPETALAECGDVERARRFRAALPVLGLDVDDYLPRHIAGPGGREVVADLRFRGLDPDRPFVQLRATSFDLGPADLAWLVPAARERFGRARPGWLSLFVAADREDDPGWGAYPWTPGDRIVAAPLSELRGRPLPAGYERLELRPFDPESYERYLSAEPSRLQARGELERHAAAGLAWDAYVDRRWAGLIAFAPARFAGGPALEVIEQLLAPPLRGRGLGPVLQRRAIDKVPDDAALFGTIRFDNRASLATARRVGRRDVGGFRRVQLRGDRGCRSSTI